MKSTVTSCLFVFFFFIIIISFYNNHIKLTDAVLSGYHHF